MDLPKQIIIIINAFPQFFISKIANLPVFIFFFNSWVQTEI